MGILRWWIIYARGEETRYIRCVPRIFGPTGLRNGKERREENNYGDVQSHHLRLGQSSQQAQTSQQSQSNQQTQSNQQVQSRIILNPSTTSERLIMGGNVVTSIVGINIDIGFQSHGLKWRGRKAITTAQLQHMSASSRKSQPSTTPVSKKSSRISAHERGAADK
nr:uncharacterized protein LOC117276791 [Nicotiana tomentosiformis]